MRWTDLGRAVLATSGRPVLLRAIALGCGAGLVAAVFFAPNGVKASDVVGYMHASPIVRAAFWAAWIALAAPASAVAFDAPGTRTLRALPLSRRAVCAWVTALLAVPQIGWAALFRYGAGWLAAASACLLAIALEASVFAALRRTRHALLAALAALLVMADVPPAIAIAPAACLAFLATSAAWASALETRGASLPLSRTTRPLPALAAAHVLALVRVARARVAASAMSAAIGGAALYFSLVNDPQGRPIARALAVFALPLSIGAGLLCSPALASEARLRPLLRATRTPRAVLLFALAIAIGAPSSALGATAGALATSLAGGPTWSVGGAVAAWGAPLALALAAWAHRHDRTRRRDPMLFVGGVLAIGAFATWVASW